VSILLLLRNVSYFDIMLLSEKSSGMFKAAYIDNACRF
jgi:hypothetical protein